MVNLSCLVDNDAFIGIIVRVVPFASDFLKWGLGLNRLGPDISSGHLLIINYLFDVYSLGNHFHPLNVHATPVPNRQSHRDIVYRLPTIICLTFFAYLELLLVDAAF